MTMLKALVQQEMSALLVLLDRLTQGMAAALQQIPPHLQTLAEGSWGLVLTVMQEGLSIASVNVVSPQTRSRDCSVAGQICSILFELNQSTSFVNRDYAHALGLLYTGAVCSESSVPAAAKHLGSGLRAQIIQQRHDLRRCPDGPR